MTSIAPDRLAGALLVAGFAMLSATARAEPPPSTALAWSTYLRAGPGQAFAAIAELEHDTHVAVTGCADGWCRVSTPTADGFVDRDALALPRTPAPQPSRQTDCVMVAQADNRGPIPTRFCSTPPGVR